jgi:hypothetical protein
MTFGNFMEEVDRDAAKPAKVFIFSRHNRDIVERFESMPSVAMTSTDVEDGIAVFDADEISRRPQWARNVSALPARQDNRHYLRKD